jgi:cation transport ATPase
MTDADRALALVDAEGVQWTVAHCSPGRIRYRVPALQREAGRCRQVVTSLSAVPGVRDVRVNERIGSIAVHYSRRRLSRRTIDEQLRLALGQPHAPASPTAAAVSGQDPATLLLLLSGLLVTPLVPLPLRYAITSAAIAPSLWRAVSELGRPKATRNVQDAASLLLATLAGRYGAAQVNNFLHTLARYREQGAIASTEAELRQRTQLETSGYAVIRDGQPLECGADELLAGDRLTLGQSHVLPLDVVVLAGDARLRQGGDGAVNGDLEPGQILVAGTTVDEGEVEVIVLQDWKDGSYRRLRSFVEMAVRDRESADLYAMRLADKLAPYSLLVSSAVYGFTRDLSRASSTLQADFSSALNLVTPVAVEAAMARAAFGGVLFRNGHAIEQLAAVDTVVFDRFGTLTEPQWRLDTIEVHGDGDEQAVLADFSALIIGCLRPKLSPLAGDLPAAVALSHQEVLAITEHGLHMTLEGRQRSLVGADALARYVDPVDPAVAAVETPAGIAEFYLLEGDRCAGRVRLANKLAPGCADAIAALRALGMQEVHMVTHEHASAVHPELESLGLDGIHSELDELDKLQFIHGLIRQGKRVALVSDGLFQARGDCLNICLAARPETRQLDADVWLLWPELQGIVSARKLAVQANRVIERNYRASLTVNGGVLLAASFDLLPPTVAAILSNSVTLGMMRSALAIREENLQ